MNKSNDLTYINWHRPDKAVPDKKYDCDFKYQFLVVTEWGYELCNYCNGHFIGDESDLKMSDILYWKLLTDKEAFIKKNVADTMCNVIVKSDNPKVKKWAELLNVGGDPKRISNEELEWYLGMEKMLHDESLNIVSAVDGIFYSVLYELRERRQHEDNKEV